MSICQHVLNAFMLVSYVAQIPFGQSMFMFEKVSIANKICFHYLFFLSRSLSSFLFLDDGFVKLYIFFTVYC